MKNIIVIVLLSFIFSLSEAQYLRTIRIATFDTQTEAQKGFEELNQFISLHQNVLDLQKEWNFEFKQRRSGKYYITIVEPFTQRKVLQEVINVLRINYPDVFVTSMKTPLPKEEIKPVEKDLPLKVEQSTPLVKDKEVEQQEELEVLNDDNVSQEQTQEVTLSIPVQEAPELNNTIEPQAGASENMLPTQIENSEVIEKEEVEEEISIPQEVLDAEAQDVEIQKFEQADSSYILYFWQTLSFLLFIVLLYLLKKMSLYKKENEVYFNSDLIHKEKYNQLSLEVKDREKYLSYVSHELRTPMTTIIGLTNLLLEANLQMQEKEYLIQIESSAENLLHIVNDIVDVSKIKAGELHIEKAQFNINSLLDYVLSVNSMQANKNNVSCMLDIAIDVPLNIIGDSLRLGQVLNNLLGNAVKFTKDGNVSISVQKYSSNGDNVSLEFIISDNGIGMSTEQLEKAFDSFSQTNELASKKFSATGLGLSISQEFVRMMHGELKAKSTLGEGSVFSFVLPFKLKDPFVQH